MTDAIEHTLADADKITGLGWTSMAVNISVADGEVNGAREVSTRGRMHGGPSREGDGGADSRGGCGAGAGVAAVRVFCEARH
jgi:hypothetical protein